MDKNSLKQIFSSKSDEWYTPDELYNELDWKYNFDLDPCSTHENAKCELHYTKMEDGITQDWTGHNVFCNPPYGRSIDKWVRKCRMTQIDNIKKRNKNVIVLLIPSRTDTKWFHEYIYKKNGVEIKFVRGRIKFGGSKVGAPFPSMIVVFHSDRKSKLERRAEELDDYLFEKYCIEGDDNIEKILKGESYE